MSALVRAIAFAALSCFAASAAVAAAAAPAAVPRAPATRSANTPTVPSAASALALVRNTLLAVDQANKTGNYTVLRDLGAPNFRTANDAARLAQIFSALRSQAVDLLPVAVVNPVYKEPPRLTARQMLYIAGRFPLAPRPVNFELLFEAVQGQWRIYGISIVPG